ncbi:MAG: 50S ribosomal protein L10 [Flavobacteriales bacterium]|jgi:large subunit ribosomal protein L10|nr:50S ribosomal protein L10 [Flavobacteriales bacterium]
MTREEKTKLIDQLAEKLSSNEVVYLADVSGLNAESTSKLRRMCFSRNIGIEVVKNTLLRKAMEQVSAEKYEPLFEVLKGNTSILTSSVGNVPARLIKDFREKSDKPYLKGAWVQEAIFIGDNQLENLTKLKSKDELIGDIVALLQSPAKNVLSALQSGKSTLGGIVKTLQDRAE